jgi:hypothetical protein
MEHINRREYKSSFFRIWKERFSGVSPVVLKAEPSSNGAILLYTLEFDKSTWLYRKRLITYTADEIQALKENMFKLGHNY